MKLAFIVPNFLTIAPVRRRHRCSIQRRPILICATSPRFENSPENSEESNFSNKSEDPKWMKLAESIAPDSVKKDPVRPPPQWSYPEGDPRDVGDQNPWDTWNAAQSTEQNIVFRDPKAETDFWRSTAREMIEGNTDLQLNDVSKNTSEEDSRTEFAQSTTNVDNVNNSEKIWTMARGVTGEMTSLQNRLREELDQYDPDHNRDQYRDIARELVGPEDDEPWEGKDPVRSSDDVSTSAGWNPDVDWTRFDDVGRGNILAEEAAKRRSVEEDARRKMQNALNSTTADETVEEDIPPDSYVSVDGKIPNFIANRLRSDGTYGSGWSGAQKEMESLKAQGLELRDSKMDADRWRLTARELIGEKEQPDSEGDSIQSELFTKSSTPPLQSSENIDQIDTDTSNGNERNLWSSWRSRNNNWKRANEILKPKDPKREVDIWRSSARELMSSNLADTSESITTPEPSESNVWDQWRKANAQWEEGLMSQSEINRNSNIEEQRLEGGRVDWGAGLGKTNSERGAWDNWNRVAGQSSGDDAKMWWSTRQDGSVRTDRSRIEQDFPLVNEDEDVAGSREERLGNDISLQAWRSIAKELKEAKEMDG